MRQSQSNRIILIGTVAVILGLMLGAGLGLLLSRGIRPPGQSSKAFSRLSISTKEDYIILVGAAYSRDRNLESAKARLARLEAPNIHQWIASLVDRSLTGEWDEADTRALMELAHGLGVDSPQVLAYLATPTPPPTRTSSPAETSIPSETPTSSSTPVVDEPTVPPTATNQPTEPPPLPSDTPIRPTPTTAPSDTPISPTPTIAPSDTPQPQPSNTSKPQPTITPKPTNTPAPKWSWTARLVGPGQEGQQCADGLKLIRVTVLDASGNQIPGVWVYEQYSNQYRVSGHKGDDPFWGPGEAEFVGLDGGQVCIASAEGGACESDMSRNLPCHDPPPFEDMWAAGYCECCRPGITKEDCQALYDAGDCLSISHYMWRVEFRRSR